MPFLVNRRRLIKNFSLEENLINLTRLKKALKKSGYNHKLKYQKNTSTATTKQQRKRKIIWFNPPYSMNIATNVGCYFLNLVNKHFPLHHKFSKIFNRNNMKICYCCTPSMKSRINIHNKTVAKAQSSAQARTCNCLNKSKCRIISNSAAERRKHFK